jgi:hypothetical protein
VLEAVEREAVRTWPAAPNLLQQGVAVYPHTSFGPCSLHYLTERHVFFFAVNFFYGAPVDLVVWPSMWPWWPSVFVYVVRHPSADLGCPPRCQPCAALAD